MAFPAHSVCRSHCRSLLLEIDEKVMQRQLEKENFIHRSKYSLAVKKTFIAV